VVKRPINIQRSPFYTDSQIKMAKKGGRTCLGGYSNSFHHHNSGFKCRGGGKRLKCGAKGTCPEDISGGSSEWRVYRVVVVEGQKNRVSPKAFNQPS